MVHIKGKLSIIYMGMCLMMSGGCEVGAAIPLSRHSRDRAYLTPEEVIKIYYADILKDIFLQETRIIRGKTGNSWSQIPQNLPDEVIKKVRDQKAKALLDLQKSLKNKFGLDVDIELLETYIKDYAKHKKSIQLKLYIASLARTIGRKNSTSTPKPAA